jgi:hypothetical protein
VPVGISVPFPSLLNDLDATVIVAVVTVGVMQVAVDEIVNVVTVGYRFVPAARAVLMAGLMTGAMMIRRTPIWILRSHLDHMFLHKCRGGVPNGMVKVPVVNIINVIFVFDRGVTASRTVLMAVVRMWLGVFHDQKIKLIKRYSIKANSCE